VAGLFFCCYLHQAMNNILLRPWKIEDAEQLASIANNKKIWLNLRDRFPHPYNMDNAKEWLKDHVNETPVQHFCIEYDGSVAGSIGVIPKDDVYRKSIEIGYFVGEPFWGKGIATKAIALLLEYIKIHFDVIRVYAEVFDHNKASMHALRKNGFYLESIRRKAAIKDGILQDDCIWVKLLN
jgi:ribosomal-protein-alanine N-acetyltransferase